MSEAPDFAFDAAGWVTRHDPLFGAFRERVLGAARGFCRSCGEVIAGQAYERERGQVTWLAHYPECPRKARGGKK